MCVYEMEREKQKERCALRKMYTFVRRLYKMKVKCKQKMKN